jgi:hypothetical protein
MNSVSSKGLKAMKRIVLLSALVVSAGCQPDQQAAAQGGGSAAGAGQSVEGIPRTLSGQPDLSGIWQALSDANWDLEPHAARQGATENLGAIGAVPPGLGVIDGESIPYLPAAREQRDRNFADRRTDDPEAKCFNPGIPRATYMPQPFQIVQSDSDLFFAYQYRLASRTIHIEEQVDIPVDSWMGWSNGRWEGDTLVIEVSNQNGQTWLDRAGNYASANARVIERFTPIGPNHIQYEATIEDPTVFERAWTISMPLYRRIEPNMQLLEFKCVIFAEELMYGHLSIDAAASEGGTEE